MAPGTNTGAAHPVIPGYKMDDVMKERKQPPQKKRGRALAIDRGDERALTLAVGGTAAAGAVAIRALGTERGGTGGTPYMQWLGQLIAETRTHKIV